MKALKSRVGLSAVCTLIFAGACASLPRDVAQGVVNRWSEPSAVLTQSWPLCSLKNRRDLRLNACNRLFRMHLSEIIPNPSRAVIIPLRQLADQEQSSPCRELLTNPLQLKSAAVMTAFQRIQSANRFV